MKGGIDLLYDLRFNVQVVKSRGDVSRDVLVTLFVTGVLGDVVEVITTDNDGTLHLGRGDNTGQDTTLDVDFTNIGALLVNVGTVLGFLGGLETVTDFLEPTLVLGGHLGVLEDVRLLLVSLFELQDNIKVSIYTASMTTV
jgi:hypothetical protein